MKRHPKLFISIILFFLFGCNANPEENTILSFQDVVIPEMGPIIVSGWVRSSEGYYSLNPGISSFDQDQTTYQPVYIDVAMEIPVWSSNGRIIFGTSFARSLAAVILETGEQKLCTDYSGLMQVVPMDDPDNPYAALVSTYGAIYAYDIDRCEEIAVVVDYWDEIAWNMLNTFSYDAPSNTLYYGVAHNYLSDREFQIISLNLESGLLTVVGERHIFMLRFSFNIWYE